MASDHLMSLEKVEILELTLSELGLVLQMLFFHLPDCRLTSYIAMHNYVTKTFSMYSTCHV